MTSPAQPGSQYTIAVHHSNEMDGKKAMELYEEKLNEINVIIWCLFHLTIDLMSNVRHPRREPIRSSW